MNKAGVHHWKWAYIYGDSNHLAKDFLCILPAMVAGQPNTMQENTDAVRDPGDTHEPFAEMTYFLLVLFSRAFYPI